MPRRRVGDDELIDRGAIISLRGAEEEEHTHKRKQLGYDTYGVQILRSDARCLCPAYV